MKKNVLKYYRNIAVNYLFKITPIKNDQFYFCSFHGQYCDSPRRVSEKIHELMPESRIVWEINDKSNEQIPDYITTVIPYSTHAQFVRSQSKYIIENYMGWSYGYVPVNSRKMFILSHQKKKGQVNISTWHGTPLKKIAIDEPSKQGKAHDFYTTSDLLLCNSIFLKNIFEHITLNKIRIMMSGSPRNDILFSPSSYNINELKKKMKLPTDKKILLYAPTFRDNNVDMSGLNQLKEIDYKQLSNALSQKFGGEWILVFRGHDNVIREISKKEGIVSEFVYSGNILDDMAEYQLVADALLTDYSGTFYDYLITRRPCFLYCPDFEHYCNVERGFYFDVSTLPFPLAKTIDELYENIIGFDSKLYHDGIERFIEELGLIDNGEASEHVIDYLRTIKRGKTVEK